jgi:glycosyltransferase involved in cell wall biosynthesis
MPVFYEYIFVCLSKYKNIEYIIVDGGSTDRTLEIIQENLDCISHWSSEPDRGLYDAMNKGITRAKGEWIHLLNADDSYADLNAIARVVRHLDETCTNYFRMLLRSNEGAIKIYDFPYKKWKLYVSAYLPHPAMIISRKQYQQVGLYDLRFHIAADHHLTMRMVHQYPGKFVPEAFVVMSEGGVSSRNKLIALEETRSIAIEFGLPQLIARCLYNIKRIHWRI